MYVSAVDQKGEPVEGLGQNDFVVREDGVQREVLRVTRATEPIDIAILVDDSAASESLIPRVREALRSFIAKMAMGNQIAIVGLADRRRSSPTTPRTPSCCRMPSASCGRARVPVRR
jgi:hypothetical protein